MRVNHALGLIASVLYVAPVYLWSGMPDQLAWLVLQVCCLLFLVLLFRLTGCRELGLRSLWALGILYTAGEVLTDWWLPEQYVKWLGPIELVVFVLGFVWTVYRPTLKLRGAERNEETVLLVFYRPRTYLEVLKALIGLPFISLSVYAGGKWLRFRHSETDLQLLDLRPSTERYMLVDTGVKVDRTIRVLMTDLEGAPARHWTSLYMRCQCVLSLIPILRMLGPEWEPRGLDFLPGVYAYRRLYDGRR